MQVGHSDPPVCLPESRKPISPMKGTLPPSGGKRTPLPPEMEFRAKSLRKQTLLLL